MAIHKIRNLSLDIFNLNGNKICELYDSTSEISDQAYDIIITTQRNGWKELSFNIPAVSVDGEENERIRYLISDYKIRATDDSGEDWFIISEPRISHNNLTKNISVTAGHVSQILKTKNLALVFNDDEGNNVGTAAQLLTTILEGTGWTVGTVDTFYEKDGTTEKVRSLKAPAKTGAFNLISKMCDLFDAKAVYDGAAKNVSIMPMNPFSMPEDGQLPDIENTNNVLEIHYGINTNGISRTLNSENIATRLYAYGSFGDTTTGYCGIDECTHKVYTFTNTNPIVGNEWFRIQYTDEADIENTLYFYSTNAAASGTEYIYSTLDPASKMYIWDTLNECAYKVQKEIPEGTVRYFSDPIETDEKNYFSSIMDFDYYNKNGMLTDEMLQKIAAYQMNAPEYIQESSEASAELYDKLGQLSETIGVINYCKLNVSSASVVGGFYKIVLGTPRIIYRTDYEEKEKNQFKWITTEKVKPNGDPLSNSGASILYVVHHNNGTVTYDKAALKAVENTKDSNLSTWFTIHADNNDFTINTSNDEFYLFQSDSISGNLGALEVLAESNTEATRKATVVVTNQHPVYFGATSPEVKYNSQTVKIDIDPTAIWVSQEYGWWWKDGESNLTKKLYFCWITDGDVAWKQVWFTNTQPTGSNRDYWYDWKNRKLYRKINSNWTYLDDDISISIAQNFSTVYSLCREHDKYYYGYSEYYTATESYLSQGNYALKNDWDTYYCFTIPTAVTSSASLSYDTKHQYITMTVDGSETVLETKAYSFDSIYYPAENILADVSSIPNRNINTTTGVDYEDPDNTCSAYIQVVPNEIYDVVNDQVIYCLYDSKKRFIGGGTAAFFYTTATTKFVRLSTDNAAYPTTVVRLHNYANKIIAGKYGDSYTVINATGSGELKGIYPLFNKFLTLTEQVYGSDGYLKTYQDAVDAQKAYETEMQRDLGDIYREGYWQDSNYVDGDEQRLYDDALDTLTEIAHPEAKYQIQYLDLYGAESYDDIGCDYPDVDIKTAVHLVDPDIDINCWAYIDTLKKCYDVPWKTQIEINTKLNNMSQHLFTDVIAHIAQVASELDGKQTKYDKAVMPTSTGKLAAEELEGYMNAAKARLDGAASNWYTDNDGNIILETADGTCAMKLTGSGFAIASEKNSYGEWRWRSFGNGKGFYADEIVAGILHAAEITIMGSEMFYWNGDNIYVFNPSNSQEQIRIGKYDGKNYGIGFTHDGGTTWETAIDFNGARLSSAIENRIAALEVSDGQIKARLEDDEGNISDLQSTASGLTERLEDAEGNITTLTTTAASLQSQVNDKVSNSVFKQTSDAISMSVNSVDGTRDLLGWSHGSYTTFSGDEIIHSRSGAVKDTWLLARSPNINLPNDWKGKQYTLSFDMYSDHWNQVEADTSGGIYVSLRLLPQTDSSTITRWNVIKSGGKWGPDAGGHTEDTLITNGVWHRVYCTFTLPTSGSFNEMYIMLNMRRNGTMKYRRAKLEVGTVATGWEPSPSDSTDNVRVGSSVVINKDQVKFETPMFQVNILDGTTQTEMLKINQDGVTAKSLIATEINGPIVQVYTGPTSITINNSSDFKALIDNLAKKYVPANMTITIPNGVKIDGFGANKVFDIRGLSGSSITIKSSQTTGTNNALFRGWFRIVDCTNRFIFKYIDFYNSASTSYGTAAFEAYNAQAAMSYCNFNPGNGGTGILASEGSRVSVNTCGFANVNAGYSVLANSGSTISCTACKGVGVAGSADRCGLLTVNSASTMPKPENTETTVWHVTNGSPVVGTPHNIVDMEGEEPIPPQPTTNTYTFKAKNSARRGVHYGSTWDWTDTSAMRQGVYWEDGTSKRYYGIADFEIDQSIVGNITGATLTVYRREGGASGSVLVRAYVSNNFPSPGQTTAASHNNNVLAEGYVQPASSYTMTINRNYLPSLTYGSHLYIIFDPGDSSLPVGMSESANTATLSTYNEAIYISITTEVSS